MLRSTQSPVLVVDDSMAMRALLAKALALAGVPRADILTSADGRAALEVIRAERPYLVLTDLNMPRLDGLELVRFLAATERLDQTTVIVVTSRSNMRELNELFGAGVAAVLRKPLELEDLARELRPFVRGGVAITALAEEMA